MGRQNEVPGVPHGMVRRQGLRNHDVQGGAGQPVAVQGPRQGVLVQGAAPAHVDDVGVRRQQGDALPGEDVLCLRGGGQRHHQDFCLRQHVVQPGDRQHLVKTLHAPAGAAEAGDPGGAHAPQTLGHVGADVAGAQDGKRIVPDGADGQLPGPAVGSDHRLVLRHPPQQHEGHHDHVFGNGDAVAAGVGQKALGIGKDGGVLAVDVHPGEGAAVPPQGGGSGFQQLQIVGVEHLTVLQAGPGLLKLIQVEKVDGKACFFSGFFDLRLVRRRQKFQIYANITAHTVQTSLEMASQICSAARMPSAAAERMPPA